MHIRGAAKARSAFEVYPLAMKNNTSEPVERLIRVLAVRRGKPVELRVHYEHASVDGCETYRLFSVEDAHMGTSTD